MVPGAHGDSPPIITFTAEQPRLLSPLLRNLGSSPRRLPPQQFPILGRIARDGNDDDDAQSTQGVEECLRCKDVSSLRMLALPNLTGAFRAWRNAFLSMLMALDSSSENLLY